METKIATFSGMVMGYITNVLTGNIFTALVISAATGFFAYVGQQAAKWIHNKIKNNGKRRA